ncbi:MAG: response regulator transcription factor [Bacillota bacterium]|nr:response regulator transcription factor [Bacillota bacterium]
MKVIWVVDDEENIRNLIKRYLEKESYIVRTFSSAEELNNALLNSVPDMFILDIMLPDSDGLNLCRMIREEYNLPVIFVSARGEEFDRVLGLEIGGDDYLAKPFSPRELVARVKNIFRRIIPQEDTEATLEIKNMIINPGQRKVTIGGIDTALTSKEFDLLMLMARSPNYSFSRKALLENIWGYDYEGDERAVDDTIKRIRKKIREKGAQPELTTVWGYGYRLDV